MKSDGKAEQAKTNDEGGVSYEQPQTVAGTVKQSSLIGKAYLAKIYSESRTAAPRIEVKTETDTTIQREI